MDLLVDAAAAAAAVAPDHHVTTIKDRYSIVALYEDGQSIALISRKLHFNRRTVSHWIDEYLRTTDVKDRPRTGRPRVTDDITDTNITLTAIIDKFTSPRQIKRKLELDGSRMTIDRRLQEAGLFG